MLKSITTFFSGDERLLSICAGVIILLIFGEILLLFWNFKIAKRLRTLFSGKNAKDLEEVLAEYIKRLRSVDERLTNTEKKGEEMRRITDECIQKYSLVRFNPFHGTGGNQSFSAAFLDGQNNGVVLTSLFTRDGAHLYAKPIVESKSTYQLTSEEEQAISQAIKEREVKKKDTMKKHE